jgi:hypothetical protein
MEETVNSEQILSEEQIVELITQQKKAQAALQSRLAQLSSERVQTQIDALSAAARKRKEEEDKEAEVLAELARKRHLRQEEEKIAEQRAIDARKKLTLEEQEKNQKAANERRRLEAATRELQAQIDLTHKLEADKAQILEDLKKAMLPPPEPEKTATVMDTPMRVALAPRDVNGHVITVAPVEISATENQRIQARLDMEKEVQMQTPQGTQGPRPVDGNTSAAFTKLFKDSTQEQCNAELAMSLLSNFDADQCMKALAVVAEQHKVTRLSVQGIVSRIRMILEGKYGTPAPAPAPVAVDRKIRELPKQQCSVCGAEVPFSTAAHCGVILNIRSAKACGLLSAADAEKMLEQRGQR